MKRPFILFAALLLAFDVPAEEPEKLLEALRSELRAELKAGVKEGESAQNTRLSRIEGLLMQLGVSDSFKEERLPQTISQLEQINAISFSEKVTKLCQALVTSLREHSARRQTALSEKFDITLRSTLKQGLEGTAAKDLDAPLSELSKLQKEIQRIGYRDDGRPVVNAEALSAVEQILTAIQDALLTAGRTWHSRNQDPVDNLKTMAGNAGRQLNDIMPRSEFLAAIQKITDRISSARSQTPSQPASKTVPQKVQTREESDKEIQSLVQSVKKLDDLGAVILKIEEITSRQRQLGGFPNESGIAFPLRAYQQTYNDLKSGASASMSFFTTTHSSGSSAEAGRIRDMLVRFALPRALGVAGEQNLKADEPIAAYLHRMLNASREASDWQLLSRVVDAVQTMRLNTVATSSDASALRLFLGGLNQERARQFSSAVASYLAALKSGSQLIPVERIGELLDALKKTYPADYEAGSKLIVSYSPMGDPIIRTSSFPSFTLGTSSTPVPSVTESAAPVAPKAPASSSSEQIKRAEPAPPVPPTKDAKKPQ